MTIREAIEFLDNLKPNQYGEEEKIAWLSKLDGMVWLEVFKTHADCPETEFTGYTQNTDTDTELLIEAPYDLEVYVPYLQACIDRENGEFVKYNQSISIYNNAYKIFCDYYNRTHRPLHHGHRFFF